MSETRPGRWVLATSNRGKLAEFRRLLGPSDFELVAVADLVDYVAPEETASTFVENALIKARHAALATGLPALADDSGLVVPALDGAPGVRSARYAGPAADDSANLRKLLADLEGRPAADRSASFHCAIAALRSADDPLPIIAVGSWNGSIAAQAAGHNGFGYDPVFFDPTLDRTAAELPAEIKNGLSHRARAVAELRRQLDALAP
jgi:XTP/dITP diphosphohydrolase